MERAICLAMGYVFGLFQTGYLYSKSKHMDIRNYGSGNAGSTNVLRVMGVKAGLIVFLGDAGKMILACLLTRMLYAGQPEMLYVYLLYTGLGVILGHNYPFYMGFKGGKGIAASAGLLASLDWRGYADLSGCFCGYCGNYPVCFSGFYFRHDSFYGRNELFCCTGKLRARHGSDTGILYSGRNYRRSGNLASSYKYQTSVSRDRK